MRAVVQRVSSARVLLGDRIAGEIGPGLLALVGVGTDDHERDAAMMAEKIVAIRVFADPEGRMNLSLRDCGGALLLVSQFTLLGDVRRGRRPSFIAAAKGPLARRLYQRVGSEVEGAGIHVAYGEFGAHMTVELVNDGPVTILIDTRRTF